MRPILAGIQKLSQGETFHLEEKGKLAEINTGLNHASDYLAKRIIRVLNGFVEYLMISVRHFL